MSNFISMPFSIMDISIVVPAYNEERRIVPTLEKICSYFSKKGVHFEVLVVDDGSADSTVHTVLKFQKAQPEVRLLQHSSNKGKGAAVRTGILNAQGKLVLFSDSDLSTPIEEFEKLSAAICQGYDIAIGSRRLPESVIPVSQPLHRRISGTVFPFLVRLIVMPGFRDTQCGFKLFTRNVAQDIFSRQKLDGFAFDVEILYLAKKLGYRVKEVPVTWINSPLSSVSIISASFKMFRDLLFIRFRI